MLSNSVRVGENKLGCFEILTKKWLTRFKLRKVRLNKNKLKNQGRKSDENDDGDGDCIEQAHGTDAD